MVSIVFPRVIFVEKMKHLGKPWSEKQERK